MSHTPDTITTPPPSDSGGDFTPHPAGVVVARCVDLIDMGLRVDRKWGKINPKIRLVFRTPVKREDGQPFDVSVELTLSMADKANLRKLLESWRGRAYTQEQLAAGVPLHKLVGQPAMLNIVHGQSKEHPDRTYARIETVMAPMAGVPVPELNGYERAGYWAEKRAKYAEELRAYRAEPTPAPQPTPQPFGDIPEALDDDDEDDGLPF